MAGSKGEKSQFGWLEIHNRNGKDELYAPATGCPPLDGIGVANLVAGRKGEADYDGFTVHVLP